MIAGWLFAAMLVVAVGVRDGKSRVTRDILWALRVTFVIAPVAEIVR